MNHVLKLNARLSVMITPVGQAEPSVPRSTIMRLVLIIIGLLLVVPLEAQKAGAEAVNSILDELGMP